VSERRLWESIRGNRLAYRFRRQYPLGGYYLDFYCFEARLAVEVDGEQHAAQAAYDAARDAFLEAQGVYVLRIPSIELFDELGGVQGRWLRRIAELCAARSKRGQSQPQ
jgi:BirA family biotin operon repressor/biotin-[acetyl-CoA-carboxylase] ligase